MRIRKERAQPACRPWERAIGAKAAIGRLAGFPSFQVLAVQKKPNQFRIGKHAISVYDLRVWGEINYLDSATDYREYLMPHGGQPSAPTELELLDDQIMFSWTIIAKFVSITAAACVILLILTSNP